MCGTTSRKSEEYCNMRRFCSQMEHYYKPIEKPILKKFQFRSLTQHEDETFPSLCNRVQKEAIYRHFKCYRKHCTAEDIPIRDQILIELRNNDVRQDRDTTTYKRRTPTRSTSTLCVKCCFSTQIRQWN